VAFFAAVTFLHCGALAIVAVGAVSAHVLVFTSLFLNCSAGFRRT
jgi:hypothetical protein